MHVVLILVLAHVQGQPGMVRPLFQFLDAVEMIETVPARHLHNPHHLDAMCIVHLWAEKVLARSARQQAERVPARSTLVDVTMQL